MKIWKSGSSWAELEGDKNWIEGSTWGEWEGPSDFEALKRVAAVLVFLGGVG